MARLTRHIIMVAMLILIAIFSFGCKTNEVHMCPSGVAGGTQEITDKDVFICPDGTKSDSVDGCFYPLKRNIDHSAAENNAYKFITGYVSAKGWNPNIVNLNFVNGSYETQVVVSKHEKDSFQTILLVDGQTGRVSCKSDCSYINS
ncbi:MAG: hypothetical protein ACOCU6_02220 [Nanoarchaeota archaeon]